MTKTAKEYHDETSYKRNMLGNHQLDWQNQPELFKKYKDLVEIPLPKSRMPSGFSIKSIQDQKAWEYCTEVFDINKISTILRLTYCITAESRFSRGIYYYRSAASAGALYPVEIYVMARDIDRLDDGVYHYNLMNQSLTRLRKDDFSDYTGSITFPRPENRPQISFILSSIFFRSSWKYRDRAYRYHLLDTGHVLENLILALNSLSIFFELSHDFNDDKLNELVGIDQYREAGLAIVNIPGKESMPDKADLSPDTLPDEITNAGIMSNNDIDHPVIREIHEAGKMSSNKELSRMPSSPSLFQTDKWEQIKDTTRLQTGIPYPECLFLRRSKRNFIDEKITHEDFMSILDIISDCPETEINSKDGSDLLQKAFFAEKIDGITPGLYTLDRSQRRFGLIHEGIFGGKIAHTCLDQKWLKNAGIHILFMCNIEELDKKYGPRGYRYAMLNAGRIGQSLYITTISLGLGCCGIGAFYDDEAAELIGLNGEFRLLYLVAIGKIKS